MPARFSPSAVSAQISWQPADVPAGVPAGAARAARRVQQPLPLVDPQRLRVQPGQLGGHRDAEQPPVQVRPPRVHHGRPRSRARYRSARSASTASLMSSSRPAARRCRTGAFHPDRARPQRRPRHPRQRRSCHPGRPAAGTVTRMTGCRSPGEGPVIGGAAARVAEHLPGLGQGAEPARRVSVARPGIGVLSPGPAPPGQRDLLPGGPLGHAEQLVQIRARAAVIRSRHDRHLPFADKPATSCLQYAPGENLSRALSGKSAACYIDAVSVT